MEHTQQILAPNHLTVAAYAKMKRVSRTSVYNHISDKKIIPDLVGQDKTVMIDVQIYGDYSFTDTTWKKTLEKRKDDANQ